MRFLLPFLVLASFAFAQTAGESIPWKREGFDPAILVRKDMPEDFSLHHMFSVGFAGNSWGYARSGATYLSMMEYHVSPDLRVSAAMGFSTTLWSTAPSNHPDPFHDDVMKPELRIPYVALDYRISKNANMRIQISDGSYCDGYFYDSCWYRPYRYRY